MTPASIEQIARAAGFSLEELALNGAGLVSPRQQSDVLWGGVQLGIWALLGFGVSVGDRVSAFQGADAQVALVEEPL